MGRVSVRTAEKVAFQFPDDPSIVLEVRPARVSFRRLAALKLLPWGASSMWRAAKIYALAQAHPELYEYKRLGVGHLAAMLALPPPLRLTILRRAEQCGWPRRKVEMRIRAIVQRKPQEQALLLTHYLDELDRLECSGVFRRPELPETETSPARPA